MEPQNSNVFNPLATDRLFLRGLDLSDGPQIAAIRSDTGVNRYLDRPVCISLAEAEAFIKKIQASVANNESYYWAISLKGDNRLIGTICLWNIDRENSTIEVGYELFPAQQGKGLMNEALKKVIEYSFGELGFKTMIAFTHHSNSGSIRLLEKNGFMIDKNIQDNSNDPGNEVAFSLRNRLKTTEL